MKTSVQDLGIRESNLGLPEYEVGSMIFRHIFGQTFNFFTFCIDFATKINGRIVALSKKP
jgi:hypothetical protein